MKTTNTAAPMALSATLAMATMAVTIATAHADGEDTWTYWGDGVSPVTGDRVTTFNGGFGGPDDTTCSLSLRVRRYPDLPNSPGWLEPASYAQCPNPRGTAFELTLDMWDEHFNKVAHSEVIQSNTLAAQARVNGPRGRRCFTVTGIKNGSYTGAGQLDICGTW